MSVVPSIVPPSDAPSVEASGLGLSVNWYYAGGFLQAGDLRILATSEEFLQWQLAPVKAFADENFLTLNLSKCKIIIFSRDWSATVPICRVDESALPAGDQEVYVVAMSW